MEILLGVGLTRTYIHRNFGIDSYSKEYNRRWMAMKRTAKRDPVKSRECALCGKYFMPVRSTQIYCKPKCRHKANWRKLYRRTFLNSRKTK